MPIDWLRRLHERKRKLESGDIEDSRNLYYESNRKEEEIKRAIGTPPVNRKKRN